MPKEWTQYKAQIEQLYILEGKTLEEVKNVLETQHGFIASTRAYRMKLDEWGFRKNQSSNEHRSIGMPPLRTFQIGATDGQSSRANATQLTRRQQLNQQAQRTFRERKELYVKALEQQIPKFKDNTEIVTREKELLAEENQGLKGLLSEHGIQVPLISTNCDENVH